MTNLIRTFVAIPLDPALQKGAAAVQDQMRAWPMNVSWVKPGNLHMTLRFLGEVEAEAISPISAAIAQVVEDVSAFSITFTRLGTFPNWRKPRVIWIGLEREVPKLNTLARRLVESLAEAGYPGDDKPFKAHLTLGRVRSSGKLRDADRLATSVRATLGRQHVNDIVLMKSTLHPQGSIYEPIATFPLRGACFAT